LGEERGGARQRLPGAAWAVVAVQRARHPIHPALAGPHLQHLLAPRAVAIELWIARERPAQRRPRLARLRRPRAVGPAGGAVRPVGAIERQPRLLETRQVGRDPRLWYLEDALELPHGQLLALERGEQAHAGWIVERAQDQHRLVEGGRVRRGGHIRIS